MPSPSPTLDLQCHCLTFTSPSTLHPTPCDLFSTPSSPYSSSQYSSSSSSLIPPPFDWPTAQSLAATHSLKIQLASASTVSRLLSADRPLPTSVLMRMSDGAPMPLEDGWSSLGERVIVCGFGDEVERIWGDGVGSSDGYGATYQAGNGEGRGVGSGRGGEAPWTLARFTWDVILVLLLCAVVYVYAGDVWKSVRSRFPATPPGIRLSGDEKILAAATGTETGTGSTSFFDLEKDGAAGRIHGQQQPLWDRRRTV
ncbi:hypothetical protein K491DRAFT_784050 [Lophiostoma macrostomum CBS 122681]|uniref:Uncharacterized protein n=1 Tax=Lophiostoma macrostomum CBS 122681 TaxID=1314788 RepID=A0A6A6SNC9_9PLEO|nr:hypothetical protein K491DRAFT_784050 [Lophiostoma macrostomum CBS 122681]